MYESSTKANYVTTIHENSDFLWMVGNCDNQIGERATLAYHLDESTCDDKIDNASEVKFFQNRIWLEWEWTQ